ncbi:hypothetical protein [Bradyrhizobium lablabi]|uniref:hypothetical protein n=1 Tax=Bradyrhizobium lablabi TaxID=722472 RepID=UPI001BAE26D0|nr:hypothetical protein [Bradyrhizobium lablabi]MBR0693982.1 hypothetical protein [Bradyrhizobium lablabi]
MHLMSRPDMTDSLQLQALIEDLNWRVQLFNADISEEEKRTKVFDPANVAYSILAMNLRERRQNLLATIRTLDHQLRAIDPLVRAAA